MTTTNIYSINGTVIDTINVPTVFATLYRPDIIKKAILASEANKRQPYGPAKRSGMRHSVSTWGKGRGTARVQRIHDGKRAAESPNNVSGRRAHPPYPERIWTQKINKKELNIARRSAIAATGKMYYVRSRGHIFDDSLTFPIVVEDAFQNLEYTSEVVDVLKKIGIANDINRAKIGHKIRAGRGKMRNRKYRTPTSVLIVVKDDSRLSPIFRSASNLPGVVVEEIKTLSTYSLAPGGDAGRLTIYTKSAIDTIEGWVQ